MAITPKDLMSTQTGGEGETIQLQNIDQPSAEDFQAAIPAQAPINTVVEDVARNAEMLEVPRQMMEEQAAIESQKALEVKNSVVAMSPDEAKKLWDEGYRPELEGAQTRGGKDITINNIFNTRKEIKMVKSEGSESQPDIYDGLGLERKDISLSTDKVIPSKIEQKPEANMVSMPDGTFINFSQNKATEQTTPLEDISNIKTGVDDLDGVTMPDGTIIAGTKTIQSNKESEINSEYSEYGVAMSDGLIDVDENWELEKDEPTKIPRGSNRIKKKTVGEFKKEEGIYKVPGSDDLYKLEGGNWYKNVGGKEDGKFIKLKAGNVEEREKYLNKNAVPYEKENLKRITDITTNRFGNLSKGIEESLITSDGDAVVTDGLSFGNLTKSPVGGKADMFNEDGTRNFNYDPDYANSSKAARTIIDYKEKGKPDGYYTFPGSEASYKKELGSWFIKPKGSSEYTALKENVEERTANLEAGAINVPTVKDAIDLKAIQQRGDINQSISTYIPIEDLDLTTKASDNHAQLSTTYNDAMEFAVKDIELLVKDNMTREQKDGLLQYQKEIKDLLAADNNSFGLSKQIAIAKAMKNVESFFNEAKNINKEINKASSEGKNISRIHFENKMKTYKDVLETDASGNWISGDFERNALETFEATAEIAEFIIYNEESGKIKYDDKSGSYVITDRVGPKERQILEAKLQEMVSKYDTIQNERYEAVDNQIAKYRKNLRATEANISKINNAMSSLRQSGMKTSDPAYKAIAEQLRKEELEMSQIEYLIDRAEDNKRAVLLTEPTQMAKSVAKVSSEDVPDIYRAIPKNISPKEQFDMFYETLQKKNSELAKNNNIDTESLNGFIGYTKDLFDWDGFYSLSKAEKKYLQNLAVLRQLSALYYNNDTGITQSSASFFESFGNSLINALFPITSKAENYVNQTEIARTELEKLSEFKIKDHSISEEGKVTTTRNLTSDDFINKDVLDQLEIRTAQDFWGAEGTGSMLGTTGGIMIPLLLTRKITSGSLRLLGSMSKLVLGTENTALVVKRIKTAQKIYNSTLERTKLGRFMKEPIETGINFETAGRVFGSAGEELHFLAGLAGGMASEGLNVLISKMPKEQAYAYIESIFKGETERAVNVIKKFGESSAKGVAETGEEFAQELSNIYRDTEDFKGIMSELEARFGSFDQVQQFVVSSFVMGAAFGLATPKSAKQAFERLPAEKSKQVQDAIADISKDLNEARDAVNEFAENKNTQEEIEKRADEYDSKNQEGVSGQEQEAEKPIEGEPVAETGEGTTEEGGDVQAPTEADEEVKVTKDGVEAFHSTYADFDQFDTNKSSENSRDFGFHFGSSNAAKKRAQDIAKEAEARGEDVPSESASNTIKAKLNIKNPLRLSEDRIGDFSPVSILRRIFKSMDESGELLDGFTQEEVDGFFNDDLQFNGSNIIETIGGAGDIDKQGEILREYLESKGYDGLVYKNEFEGGGDSYVAFRPEQIQVIEKKQTFGKTDDSKPEPQKSRSIPEIEKDIENAEALDEELNSTYYQNQALLLDGDRGAEIDDILREVLEYEQGLLTEFEAYDRLSEEQKNAFTEQEKKNIEGLRQNWIAINENIKKSDELFNERAARKDEILGSDVEYKYTQDLKKGFKASVGPLKDVDVLGVQKYIDRIINALESDGYDAALAEGELVKKEIEAERKGTKLNSNNPAIEVLNALDRYKGSFTETKLSEEFSEIMPDIENEKKALEELANMVIKNYDTKSIADRYVNMLIRNGKIDKNDSGTIDYVRKKAMGAIEDRRDFMSERRTGKSVNELVKEYKDEISKSLESISIIPDKFFETSDLIGKKIARTEINPKTGDVIAEAGDVISVQTVRDLLNAGLDEVLTLDTEGKTDAEVRKTGAERLAEQIRNLKLKPGWATGGETGVAMSTFGFDKAFELAWNTSVDIVAKTIEISGASADSIGKAIDLGLKALKGSDWYKSLNREQKKQASSEFIDEMNKQFPKKKVSSKERAKGKEFKEKVSEATGTKKPEKSVQMTELEAIKEQLKNKNLGAKELQKMKDEVKKFIVDNLPTGKEFSYTATDVKSAARAVSSAKTPASLEKAIAKVEALIDKKIESAVKAQSKKAEADRAGKINQIRNKAKNKKTLMTKRGNKWYGKVSVEAQREFRNFVNSIDMDNLEALTNEELDFIADTMDGILAEGKADYNRARKIKEKQDRVTNAELLLALSRDDKKNVTELRDIEDIEAFLDGGGLVVIDGELFNSSSYKSVYGKNKSALEDILYTENAIGIQPKNLGITKSVESESSLKRRIGRAINPFRAQNTIYSLIKNFWSGSSAVAKFIEKEISQKIKDAYVDRNEATTEKLKKYREDIENIFGTTYKKAMRRLSETADDSNSTFTPVTSRDIMTTDEKFNPTNGHLVDWYNLAQTKNGKERLARSGVDADKVIYYIESNPDLKSYADALIDMYADLKADYEPTYEAYTNTPFPDGVYYPTYSEGYTQNMTSEASLMDDEGGFNPGTAVANNMKQRTDYKGQLNITLDANAKFLDYVKNMEHAKHFLPVSKSINQLFNKANTPYLIEKGGLDNYYDLKEHLGVIINDGPLNVQSGRGQRAFNNALSLQIINTLGLNPASAIKQLTSFTHYMGAGIRDGVFIADWAKGLGSALSTAEGREFALQIITSNYVRERFAGNSQFDEAVKQVEKMSKTLKKDGKGYTAEQIIHLGNQAAMIFVKAGDTGAVIMGGVPYAKALYDKAISEGMDSDAAFDYAYRKFVTESEMAQQSTRADISSNLQREQIYKFLGTYRTSQAAVVKKIVDAARTLKQAREIEKNEGVEARKKVVSDNEKQQAFYDLLYYSVFGSMGFSAVASGAIYFIPAALAGLFTPGEDDEVLHRLGYDLFADQAQSLMQGGGPIGYLLDQSMNYFRGKEGFNEVPALKQIDAIIKSPDLLVQDKWDDLDVEERLEWLERENMPVETYEPQAENVYRKSLLDYYWTKEETETFMRLVPLAKRTGTLAENIDKLIDDPSFEALLDKVIMNYPDDYFRRFEIDEEGVKVPTEREKRDYLYEFLFNEEYTPMLKPLPDEPSTPYDIEENIDYGIKWK